MINIKSNQKGENVNFSFDLRYGVEDVIYYKTENAEYSKAVSTLVGKFSLLGEIFVLCIGLQNNTLCRQEKFINEKKVEILRRLWKPNAELQPK
jgi:hypothetical protein